MWRRLADWCLRDIEWPYVFQVNWVMLSEERQRDVRTVAGAIQVPSQLLGLGFDGKARPWPSISELFDQAVKDVWSKEMTLGRRDLYPYGA